MLLNTLDNRGDLCIGRAKDSRYYVLILRCLLTSELSDVRINSPLLLINVLGANNTLDSLFAQGSSLLNLYKDVALGGRGYEVLNVDPVVNAKLCC